MMKKIEWTRLKGFLNNYGFALILALGLTFMPQHPDRFRDQEHFVWVLLWGFYTALIAQKIHWITFPAMLWAGLSALCIFAVKFSPYGQFFHLTDGPSAAALGQLAVTLALFAWMKRKHVDLLYLCFEMLMLLNSVLLIFKFPGVLDNKACDASLIAMIFPIIWRKTGSSPVSQGTLAQVYYWFLKFVLPPIAILVSYSATGIFALVAAFLGFSLLSGRMGMLIGIVSSGVALTIGYYIQRSDLLSSSGRTTVWPWILEWFWDRANIWKGTGLGTFQVLGPSIQQDHGWKSNLFLYAHNEYIQILFEMGVIGLVLTLIVYGYSLVKTYRDQSWLFIALSVLAVVSMSQSPLRIAVMSVWVALIFKDALTLGQNSE